LVDLALLVHAGGLEPSRTSSAINGTFGRRGTHIVPRQLDPPPAEWLSQFAELSESCLAGASMSGAFEMVRAFWERLAESEVQRALDRMSKTAFDAGLYDRNEMPEGGGDE